MSILKTSRPAETAVAFWLQTEIFLRESHFEPRITICYWLIYSFFCLFVSFAGAGNLVVDSSLPAGFYLLGHLPGSQPPSSRSTEHIAQHTKHSTPHKPHRTQHLERATGNTVHSSQPPSSSAVGHLHTLRSLNPRMPTTRPKKSRKIQTITSLLKVNKTQGYSVQMP